MMMMTTATVAAGVRTMRVVMMEMRMRTRRMRRRRARRARRKRSSKVQLPVAVAGLGDQVVVVPQLAAALVVEVEGAAHGQHGAVVGRVGSVW